MNDTVFAIVFNSVCALLVGMLLIDRTLIRIAKALEKLERK